MRRSCGRRFTAAILLSLLGFGDAAGAAVVITDPSDEPAVAFGAAEASDGLRLVPAVPDVAPASPSPALTEEDFQDGTGFHDDAAPVMPRREEPAEPEFPLGGTSGVAASADAGHVSPDPAAVSRAVTPPPNIEVVAIPEPSGLLLVGTGGLLWLARRPAKRRGRRGPRG